MARETLKSSTDPDLVAKVRDAIGLYLDPPEKAIVLCVDEKSPIQALDRTATILPLRPGLAGRATHDYERNGTTNLFAALEGRPGVTDRCYDRHGKAESLDILTRVARTYARRELRVVLDNYNTHKTRRHRALAGGASPGHDALHADLEVVAQPRRGALRDHHPPGDPPGLVRQRPGARHRDPHLLDGWNERCHHPDGRRDPATRPQAGFRRGKPGTNAVGDLSQ